MKNLKNYIFAMMLVLTSAGAMVAVAAPQTVMAACSERLLTLPTWYQGVVNGNCEVEAPTGDKGLQKFIWTIGLNIVEMILQIVAYITIGFIIFGGYKYMISAGSPDGMVKARKTITNAIIGLLISIFSIAIVNLVSGALK